MTRRRGVDIGIIVATVMASRLATAAEPEVVTTPPAVHIVGPECREPPLSIAEFIETLRVELAGHGMRCCITDAGAGAAPGTGADAAPAAGELLVTLAVEPCDPNTDRVGVVVTDTRRLQAVERSVSLADLPPAARPRALALAVAELLRAAEQPAPPPPPAPAVSPETEPALAAANEAVRVAAGADALLRIYPTRQTMLLGAQLSLGVSGRRWHTELALDGALGQPSVDLGAVTVRTLGGAITAGPRFSVGHATFDVGASASAGWAWVRGEPGGAGVAARAGNGFVASAGARFAVQASRFSRIRLHVASEIGAVLYGLDANVNGSAAAGIAGAYGLFAVGVRAP